MIEYIDLPKPALGSHGSLIPLSSRSEEAGVPSIGNIIKADYGINK